jgi:hypothetical protein
VESRAGLRGLVISIALLVMAAPAGAIEEEADVRTNDGGVAVTITVGDDGAAHVEAGEGGGSSCDWSVIQYPFTGADPPSHYGAPPSPEHNLYLVYCDGVFVSAEWIAPNTSETVVDTRALANTVIEQIPVDLAAINARPVGSAITGIPSYFWVEGYDGAPITGSVSNGPVTVDVSVTLGSVTWDWGDGTPAEQTGLGEAWPARSSVRHTYSTKGTYVVTVTIVLPAQFTVNGAGAPTALEPVIRTATIPYVVDEVQAVRDR